MRITIHRGTHEIGGSCIELVSASQNSRIILDLGMPLVNPDMSPFKWHEYKNSSQQDLISKGILPFIPGLYDTESPKPDGVLLSHAHIDHYGFFRFINPQVPLVMSSGSKSLAKVSNIFLDTNVHLENIRLFKMGELFQLGEFSITPYLMDHSAPDAAAFLIEADGQRLFYTGDFRGHGRKAVLLDRLTKSPPQVIDYLLMEGSMIGRGEGAYPSERAVEDELLRLFQTHKDLTYVFTSSQNLDRLVSLYQATNHSGRVLVIDLYTAFVLDKLNVISSRIPQFNWENVRVLFIHSHAQKLAAQHKHLLYKYVKTKIEFEEILAHPEDIVLLAKDNRYFRNMIAKLKPVCHAMAVYSLWHGYLEKTDLREFLTENGIALSEIHTSGHAYVNHMQQLVEALKPRHIIPIHTFYPEKYQELFPNVIKLKDGETMNLENTTTRLDVGCKAISNAFLEKLDIGIYKPLVTLVKNNKDLHLELHGNTGSAANKTIMKYKESVGIYYKGNSILRLYSDGKISIDKAFIKNLELPKHLHNKDDIDKYCCAIPQLLYTVACYGKTSMELEYEQMIIRANNREARNNTEYIIIAHQYYFGGQRTDLLALKWPREKRRGKDSAGQLALIEVKYALNKDIKEANVQLINYYNYIKSNLSQLCSEMELILRQKLQLGLIDITPEQAAKLKNLKLSREVSDVELILLLVDYNPNSDLLSGMLKKAMKEDCKTQMRIMHGGLAMWDQYLDHL